MKQGDRPLPINADGSVPIDSYGFFLYFFDEIRGHIPLYAYPQDLMENENEKQIIAIHSIWWHQDKFLEADKFITMDLELSGVVYCATLYLCKTRRIKRRSGMESTKWQAERFVMIVRAPSTVSFIAQEILYELKTRIQGNIGENLCFLVEYNLKQNENSEIEEFISNKSKEIEEMLGNICSSLIPKMPLEKLEAQLEVRSEEATTETSGVRAQELKTTVQPKKLRFLIPNNKGVSQARAKKDPILSSKSRGIKIIQIKLLEEKEIVRITIRNGTTDKIINALVKIYESQGFFGKDVLVSKIVRWAPNEDISIEFKPSNETGMIYYLKIDDEHENFYVKRIFG